MKRSEFGRNKARRDGLQVKCRECRRTYRKERYETNKEHIRERLKRVVYRARQRNREFVLSFLKENPCSTPGCDESDPVCLDFDHVRGEKLGNICTLIGDGASLQRLQEEMDKCVVLCANCHRKKTARERGFFRYLTEDT